MIRNESTRESGADDIKREESFYLASLQLASASDSSVGSTAMLEIGSNLAWTISVCVIAIAIAVVALCVGKINRGTAEEE